MESNLTKIIQSISEINSSVNYIDSVMDKIKLIKHLPLDLQRQINTLKKQLEACDETDFQKIDISDSLKKLELELEQVKEITLTFDSMIELLYDFINNYNFRPEKLRKFSAKEIEYLYHLNLLTTKCGITKCIRELKKCLEVIPVVELLEIINSQLQLTGYNRFILKDGIIKSMYCIDLKKTIFTALKKEGSFNDVITLINKYSTNTGRKYSPLDLLKAFIAKYNVRMLT